MRAKLNNIKPNSKPKAAVNYATFLKVVKMSYSIKIIAFLGVLYLIYELISLFLQ